MSKAYASKPSRRGGRLGLSRDCLTGFPSSLVDRERVASHGQGEMCKACRQAISVMPQSLALIGEGVSEDPAHECDAIAFLENPPHNPAKDKSSRPDFTGGHQ